TFQGWDWARTCRYVSQTGYDGVEIAPFTLAEDVRQIDSGRRKEIASIAHGEGLEVVGLHWLLVSPKGLSITISDEPIRRETSDYVKALVDFCADVGGKVMVFGSPAQRRLPDPGGESVARQRFISGLLPALDRAAEAGITICIEPLPPPEADFILNLAEAKSI